MNDTTNLSLCTDQSQEKGIVLNRMYTGSYLSTNLGHEVINMFQADDDKHYLYLNAKGNFGNDGKKVGTMLLVRGVGNGSIEVVGMAKNLQRVNSAGNPLPRDLSIINETVQNEQIQLLGSIKYGTIPILKIFDEEGQQSIYVSYWVKEEDFYTPKKGVRFIIEFPPQKKKGEDNTKLTEYQEKDRYYVDEKGETKNITIRIVGHNFASTSLHQYILENRNDDLTHLNTVCNAKDDYGNLIYWESKKDRKINSSEEVERREISLFDICQIQNDENKFSNALSYFMIKYKDLWQKFIKEQFNIEEEIEIVSVTREEDAKVDKTHWKDITGGRIDLLIRTKNSYIIIENKIDSSIIEKEVNGKKITQLERYYYYAEYLKYEEIARIGGEIDKLEKNKAKNEAQYNDPKNIKSKKREEWNKKVKELDTEIKRLKDTSSKIGKRKILGCVLSPNYNQQDDNLLKINVRQELNDNWFKLDENIPPFERLSYKDIYNWFSEHAPNLLQPGIEYDADFKSFYDAMKKHTYDYENQALYEDMKNTFFARIQKCRATDSNATKND